MLDVVTMRPFVLFHGELFRRIYVPNVLFAEVNFVAKDGASKISITQVQVNMARSILTSIWHFYAKINKRV